MVVTVPGPAESGRGVKRVATGWSAEETYKTIDELVSLWDSGHEQSEAAYALAAKLDSLGGSGTTRGAYDLWREKQRHGR